MAHAGNPGNAGKVAVLGGGAWGTALAKVLADKGDTVALWCRATELATQINATRSNPKYLPTAHLPDTLTASHDLRACVEGASMVLFVAPSHATREVARLAAASIPEGIPVVSATKGIENDSLMFIDEILEEELPHCRKRLAFLSGPSFAKELAAGLPTGVVIASKNEAIRETVMRRFHAPHLRTYGSKDVIGVECGGALKLSLIHI